ncbi:MAG: DUF1080 domain-containing protein [Planctomycetes bacterium]|nr:DUF1080 domain-containing protein [Planctomycetota bacterium]
MRRLYLFAVLLVLPLGTACNARAEGARGVRWTFEDATLGNLPGGWTADKTGKGEGSVWKVIDDESAPAGSHVLAQTSSAGPNRLFNLCVIKKSKYKDLDLSVSFKAVKGKIDRGGGPVWRYQDANNYYIARMNPLEDNYRVYKVVEGRRRQLASADVKAAAGKWHTLRIVQRGSHIQCYLNDKLHLDVKDEEFKEAGQVGLWTKADAVTSFDAFEVAESK